MVKGGGGRQADRVESIFATVQRALGANVRRLRAQRELTQEQLAEAADIDVRHVQRIEAGKSNAQLDTLCVLAAALGTVPAELLALEAEPGGKPSGRSRRR